MKTFEYDDIYNYNNGKYYDYIDHHGEAKEKLNNHILDTVELLLKDIPEKKIELADIWLKHLRDRNNKRFKYKTTLQLGAQNILDILHQLVETMCHSQKTRRISVKQIENWNLVLSDLDQLLGEYYENFKGALLEQQIEMQQTVRTFGSPVFEILFAK